MSLFDDGYKCGNMTFHTELLNNLMERVRVLNLEKMVYTQPHEQVVISAKILAYEDLPRMYSK